MRNQHKIGLRRPATKHKLGLKRALAAACDAGATERDEVARNERILRDFFWLPPTAKSPGPIHRLPAPAAESGTAPRIAKKTD